MRADPAQLPRAFDLSRASYYLDFVLMPVIMLALIGADMAIGAGLAIILGLGFGAVAWMLAEYLIHRLLFHDVALFRRMHDVHHAYPRDYVGIASWGTVAAFGLPWAAFALLVGIVIANAVTAGLLCGYLFYIAIHDRMHHGNRSRFGRYMAFMFRHHAGHHRGGECNYGVSSPVFDLIFRTYRSSPRSFR